MVQHGMEAKNGWMDGWLDGWMAACMSVVFVRVNVPMRMCIRVQYMCVHVHSYI